MRIVRRHRSAFAIAVSVAGLSVMTPVCTPVMAQQTGDSLSVEQMLNKLAPEGSESKPRRSRNLKIMTVEPPTAIAPAGSAESTNTSGASGGAPASTNTSTPITSTASNSPASIPAVITVSTQTAAHGTSVSHGAVTTAVQPANPVSGLSGITPASAVSAQATLESVIAVPSAAAPSTSTSTPQVVNTATDHPATAPVATSVSAPPVAPSQPLQALTVTTPVATVASPPLQALVSTSPTIPAPALDLSILFELGSAKISKASLPTLEKLALVLRNDRLADSLFRIEGHTDIIGNPVTNLALSSRRAQSVMQFLASKGVDTGRMEAIGKGSTELLLPDQPASYRNRRVRITVLD